MATGRLVHQDPGRYPWRPVSNDMGVSMEWNGTRARVWLVLGALNGFLSVALGAYAAHGVAGQVADALLTTFLKGVHYQGFHGLALLAVGMLVGLRPGSRWLLAAGTLFALGILLFSGSLYLRVLLDSAAWGRVTPSGGGALLLGWICLGVGAWRAPSPPSSSARP